MLLRNEMSTFIASIKKNDLKLLKYFFPIINKHKKHYIDFDSSFRFPCDTSISWTSLNSKNIKNEVVPYTHYSNLQYNISKVIMNHNLWSTIIDKMILALSSIIKLFRFTNSLSFDEFSFSSTNFTDMLVRCDKIYWNKIATRIMGDVFVGYFGFALTIICIQKFLYKLSIGNSDVVFASIFGLIGLYLASVASRFFDAFTIHLLIVLGLENFVQHLMSILTPSSLESTIGNFHRLIDTFSMNYFLSIFRSIMSGHDNLFLLSKRIFTDKIYSLFQIQLNLKFSSEIKYYFLTLGIFYALGGRLTHLAPSNLCSPGIFAKNEGSLKGGLSYATKDERRIIEHFGKTYGCHSCGIKKYQYSKKQKIKGKTRFIADHQPPISKVKRIRKSILGKFIHLFLKYLLGYDATKQRFYPQCIECSQRQALHIRRIDRSGLVRHSMKLRKYFLTGIVVRIIRLITK